MWRSYRLPIIALLAVLLSGVGVGAWLLASGVAESRVSSAPPGVGVLSVTKFSDGPSPSFSPTGDAWLTQGVSSKGENLFRVRLPTGATIERPDVVGALWRPDGGLLVYRAAGPPEEFSIASVFSLSFADAELRTESDPITTTDDLLNIDFDRAGNLYYLRQGVLHKWDTVAAGETRIGALPMDVLASPKFRVSPDGQRVAYLADQVLGILDVATGTTQTVTQEIDLRQWVPYAWSPDGQRLAYSTQDRATRYPALHILSLADGRTDTILTTDEPGCYCDLVWHPSQDTILATFTGFGTDPEDRAEYLAINATSGQYTPLFTGGLGLALSPDGTKISFARTSLKAFQSGEFGSWIAELSVS